jgi:hypothetical protein
MPAESVDVVITSPPYNLGVKYNSYMDTMPRQKYLEWTIEWCREVKRLLKPKGSFFLNVGSTPKNPMLPHEIVIALRELFVLQNTFHWIKSITIERRDGEEISAGHFKPINSPRFVTEREGIPQYLHCPTTISLLVARPFEACVLNGCRAAADPRRTTVRTTRAGAGNQRRLSADRM